MSNLRLATKEDFKVGAVLVCIVEGWEITLTAKYGDGIWESREKAVFEVEASCYYIKQPAGKDGMTKPTANEIKALEACLNYDNREQQLADNMSNAGVAEFMALLGWNEQQVGGLITSMQAKSLGVMDDEDYDIFWLTEKGVNTIFDIIEQESQEGMCDILHGMQDFEKSGELTITALGASSVLKKVHVLFTRQHAQLVWARKADAFIYVLTFMADDFETVLYETNHARAVMLIAQRIGNNLRLDD